MDNTICETADTAKCRNFIIAYIINAASTKLPFKKSDISSLLNRKDKLFKCAFQEAKECLRDVYGIVVQEVPHNKSGKYYICYNDESDKTLLVLDDDQKKHLVLLFIVISYIFMNTKPSAPKVSEEQLQNFLKLLNIHFDSDHEFFGKNVKKLITETFVKQLYIQRTRQVSELDTDIGFQYSLGYRATVEFDNKLLLGAVAKIINVPSSSFDAKYKEVFACENTESEE